MYKLKYLATVILFVAVTAGLAIYSFALEDGEISLAERRKLAQLPVFSKEELFSGDYMADLETYLLDQFPFRDQFRTLKAKVRLDVFQQKDNNGIYFMGDQVLKQEYPLKENQVSYGVNKINEVIAQYLKNNQVYYAIVPDKNYFAGDDYLKMDYDRMEEMMEEVNGTYIDIFDLQTLNDYYRTDAHWKQESIYPTAEALAQAMGLGVTLASEAGFTTETLEGFQGVYWGQSALSMEPDTLTYVQSPAITAATMTSIEKDGTFNLYAPEKFTGVDGYDVYMHGAQAILTVESPNAKTDKELIIFRDSYGSSLAPYFAEGYSKITLVDLRYVMSSFLPQFIDFQSQDVLFLYSTTVLNSAMLLK